MRIVDTIIKKRDGQALSDEEIHDFVQAVSDGSIEDYQISALLMAIYFQGMNAREIASMTREMAESGERLSFPGITAPIVDKHSSGGVGDKTTLIIAPIVAACGLPVAKLSGRGLGFTGGTVDKLESIPGFQTQIPMPDFLHFIEKDGIALAGQSADLAPVDKKLYALRDVTGTVESLPLIASSIMSKKLADGSDAIVLDVKCGSGAFMKTPEKAVELASMMVSIGEANGKKTIALISNMDQPLGRAVGNNLEVIEALEVLRGGGERDLQEECWALCRAMLQLGGRARDDAEADQLIDWAIQSGQALAKFKAVVTNQGGDPTYIDHPDRFPKARLVLEGRAERNGFIQAIDAEEIGRASLVLGAGREKTSDSVDPTVGLEIFKKVGDAVEAGDLLFMLHANDEARAEEALKRAWRAYRFADQPVVDRKPLIYALVNAKGVNWLHG